VCTLTKHTKERENEKGILREQLSAKQEQKTGKNKSTYQQELNG
jgi:hypothetical protein